MNPARTSSKAAKRRELGGIVFTPRTIPSNRLVDTFVAGILTYDKAANCCSRAQEVKSVKKDPTGVYRRSAGNAQAC